MDEPTNGLDPAGIQEIRELIKSLPQKYDMTIIVSSIFFQKLNRWLQLLALSIMVNYFFEGHLSDLEEDENICLRPVMM